MKSKLAWIIAGTCLGLAAAGWWINRPPESIELNGLVTTDDVVVSPDIPGRLVQLSVREGDRVQAGQVLAQIEEDGRSYYAQSAGVEAVEGDYTVAVTQLADAKEAYRRLRRLDPSGAVSVQELDHARRNLDAALARAGFLKRQMEAKKLALLNGGDPQSATATPAVCSTCTPLRAPISGVVDFRAAHTGEYVAPGQAVVTLVDPADYWVRADVEESYIDGIKDGEALEFSLPSGEKRTGTVYYRGVDADFATQRDVSRSKRDIRTFEIRLKVDNSAGLLALGESAVVTLPVAGRP